jgi:hypothetical protein
MRRILSLLFSLLFAFQSATSMTVLRAQDAVKTVQPSAANAQVLTNGDVLKLVESKLAPEVIVEKIRSAPCDFDTSPEALQKLKDAAVPDSLILVMVMSPKGSLTRAASPTAKVSVKVPEGTVVELETAYTVNSQLVRKGDVISFRVVNPVIVAGSVVIEKGATATALVTKSERNGHFGRAGRITWEMREVTAVDGSRVPLQFTGHVVGDSKGAKVAAQTILLGVGLGLLGPLTLLHGFKRGENAVVLEGKRFNAAVPSGATVKAAASQ